MMVTVLLPRTRALASFLPPYRIVRGRVDNKLQFCIITIQNSQTCSRKHQPGSCPLSRAELSKQYAGRISLRGLVYSFVLPRIGKLV